MHLAEMVCRASKPIKCAAAQRTAKEPDTMRGEDHSSSHGSQHRRFVLNLGGSRMAAEIAKAPWPANWQVISPSFQEIDLTDSASLFAIINSGNRGEPWSAAVCSAAFEPTKIGKGDYVMAWLINTLAPASIAEACKEADVPLIHLITDHIHLGERTNVAKTDTPLSPRSETISSKVCGAVSVRESGAKHLNIRAEWVFSEFGANPIRAILESIEKRGYVRVEDIMISPTPANDLAASIVDAAVSLATNDRQSGEDFIFKSNYAFSLLEIAERVVKTLEHFGARSGLVLPVNSASPGKSEKLSDESHDAEPCLNFTLRPDSWQIHIEDIVKNYIKVC